VIIRRGSHTSVVVARGSSTSSAPPLGRDLGGAAVARRQGPDAVRRATPHDFSARYPRAGWSDGEAGAPVGPAQLGVLTCTATSTRRGRASSARLLSASNSAHRRHRRTAGLKTQAPRARPLGRHQQRQLVLARSSSSTDATATPANTASIRLRARARPAAPRRGGTFCLKPRGQPGLQGRHHLREAGELAVADVGSTTDASPTDR
jgi:hypothetical protein